MADPQHELSTRERRFAETMELVNSAMRDFLVLIEEQVTSVNAPHQVDMLKMVVEVKQIRRDVDSLTEDMLRLAEIVDRLLTRREGSS